MTGRGPKSFRTEASIRACAERGLTKQEAALELGITPACVAFYVKNFGVQFTAKGVSGREYNRCRAPRKGKYDDRIVELAAAGKSRKEISEATGADASYVSVRVAALGLNIPHHSLGAVDASRAETMAAMYRAGKRLKEIGEVYGVTRERVRQIIKKEHGLTGEDGGASATAAVRRRERERKQDEAYQKRHGCSFAEYREIRDLSRAMVADGLKSPLASYIGQRQNAKRRGIGWNISLVDWWAIWDQSGKWSQRGRGQGYMMCRFGDQGPYEFGNVYIATGVHNGLVQPNNPYRSDHPDHEKVIAERRARADTQYSAAA